MNLYDSLFSPGGVLIEQTGRQIFDIFPENGPVVVFRDQQGNCWPSDSGQFAALDLNELFINQICQKIDDGDEPVVSATEQCGVVGTQLATDKTNCGYVIVALPGYSPESILANIDLLEIILRQINLTAKLIEKNNLLYELQSRQIEEYTRSDAVSN